MNGAIKKPQLNMIRTCIS